MDNASSDLLVVGVADIKIGRSPSVIRTVLGSCVAICLYAPSLKVGGMLHFVMAYSSPHKEQLRCARYCDTGLQELIKQMRAYYKVGAEGLTAKIFGGAHVIKAISNPIGEENIAAARQFLDNHGIKIAASRTGGGKGYRIEFDVASGKVSCQVFGEPVEEY
ncbi:MAG TPA: chemotaxis protein CheD [Candidatus Omnitrophica bacterium]|nr:chemotaxis protein CheD [Candidatus Omnitrophota bacterium]